MDAKCKTVANQIIAANAAQDAQLKIDSAKLAADIKAVKDALAQYISTH